MHKQFLLKLPVLLCLFPTWSFADDQPDCVNATYFADVSQCAELDGEKELKDFNKKVEGYAKSWPSGTHSAVTKLEDLVGDFSIKEADWTAMTIHGEDRNGLINGNRKIYLFDLINNMESNPPKSIETADAKTTDKNLNSVYQKFQKCLGPNEKARESQRQWIKVRDQFKEVMILRFKGKLKADDLGQIALARISKPRIEDFQTQLRTFRSDKCED